MTPRLPARVIEVPSNEEAGQARVIDSGGCSGRYLTLSYPSSGVPLHLAHQDGPESLKVSALPATFQDAIELTRNFGVRYLWIEGLCANIGGGRSSSQRHLSTNEVFSNSYLNISASRVSDVNSSFLSRNQISFATQGYNSTTSQPHDTPCYIEITTPPNTTTSSSNHINNPTSAVLKLRRLISNDPSLSQDPISKDPTTYSHRLLSPRMVSFGRCISFHCHNGPALDTCTGDVWTQNLEYHGVTTWPMPLVAPKLLTDRLNLWMSIVRDWSAMPTQETGGGLRLLGIAGVAERYAGLATEVDTSEQLYLAGLWQEHLPQWLMWDVLDSTTAKRCPGPSWSWISVLGGVRYYVDYHMKYLCEFKGYDCTLLDQGAKYGEVRNGKLTLKVTLGRTTRFLCRIGDGRVEGLLGITQVETRRERALKGKFEAKQPEGRTMRLDTDDEKPVARDGAAESDGTVSTGEGFAVLAQEEIFLLPVKLGHSGDLTGRVWKHGLMLARTDDGTFRRFGTFTLDHKTIAQDVTWEENSSITLI
ncbi:hypothetical protein CLAFUR0_07349 [Fulvia fulva]|nr:hypothetical protein CLAFUR0_07349 [Fulvia fulva]